MLDEKFVTLISSSLATLIGGAVGVGSAYLTNRVRWQQEREQRKSEMLRERGEELYSALVRWQNLLSGHALRRSMVMNGELTYNQCLDLDLSDTNIKFDYSRIELLIDVYFPSVKKAYAEVLKQRDELNKIETPFKIAYKAKGTADRSVFKPYLAQVMQLDETGQSLQREILRCIRAIEV